MKLISRLFIKILILTLIFFLAVLINESKAAGWDDIIKGADDFLEEGEKGAEEEIKIENENGEVVIKGATDEAVKKIIDGIYNILFPMGVGITVMVGGVLGIKFMMASVEDKAKVKESMVPYAIGCIVIYGAFGIWKLAIEILSAL